MRLSQFIATLLILVLTISPALAGVCATSCSAMEANILLHNSSVNNSTIQSEHCRMMAGMSHYKSINEQNAQQPLDQNNTHEHDQNTNHKNTSHASCGMVGCNVAQVLSLHSVVKLHFAEASPIALTYHNTFGVSADVFPPVKPPA